MAHDKVLSGLIALIIIPLLLVLPTSPAAESTLEPLLSENPLAGWAGWPALSADGRMIAFVATTSGQVQDTQDRRADIFVQDRQTGELQLVSQSSAGVQANGWSYRLSLSADGRFVAYTSIADNLLAGDTNRQADIFVHDLLTGETTLASVATNGEQSNGWSDWPAISGDGRYVAFSSAGNNLVLADTNNAVDVFVHDRLTLQTHRVSVSSTGAEGDGASGWATAISGDGRWIAFPSEAGNLAASDPNERRDIFLHNRVTGKTTRAPSPWSTANDYLGSDWPALSASGSYLAYTARRVYGSGETAGREEALLVYHPASSELREITQASFPSSTGGMSLQAVISGQSLAYIASDNAEVDSPNRVISVVQLKSGESPRLDSASVLEAGLILQPEKPAFAESARVMVFTALEGQQPEIGGSPPEIYVFDNGESESNHFTLSGQVTDSTGAPLRSTTVSLKTGRSTITDRQGYFFFSGVTLGNHQLTARKEGYLFSPEVFSQIVSGDLADIRFTARSEELLDEARKDIGMPYSFHRGCETELEGCGGAYHGFLAGYCTDLILDAFSWGVDFNLQFALERDALAHPDHFYRWRNARNSHDMWRYFHYTGQMLTDVQPYQPGDILFFDWDDDSVIDHVSLLAEVDSRGRPKKMIDATGKIAYNPSGLAAELDWEIFHARTIRGHARWLGSYGATRPATPPDLQALQIAVDSTGVTARLFDSQGRVLTTQESRDRKIQGGSIFDQGLGTVLSVLDPLNNGDTYILELEGRLDSAYNLQIQTLKGGLVTRYVAHNQQSLKSGEVRLIGIQLIDFEGKIDLLVINLR